jgi:hypothetical protein
VLPDRSIWIISLFSIDKPIMKDELQQIQASEDLPFSILEEGKFYDVFIDK